MTSLVNTFSNNQIKLYRFLILVSASILLFGVFWILLRYPWLFSKAEHIQQAIPSMGYSSELFAVSTDLPIWKKILFSTINWLNGMKIGMTFGVLFGALLHTYLKYFPLTLGDNVFLNTIKGALVGIPTGVCANCAVPAACGLTRGKGRVEVALGFLFSSPNFNPVVISMTLVSFPLAMILTKYLILLGVILLIVPIILKVLEHYYPFEMQDITVEEEVCELPISNENKTFGKVFKDLSVEFGKNLWMLVKPTISLMLVSAILASAMLVLIPWSDILTEANPFGYALVSFLAVIMPVPIALDVIFASQLQSQGADNGYVMLFLMTLGTYSIVPMVYLWREISKTLSVSLFLFFFLTGWLLGMFF